MKRFDPSEYGHIVFFTGAGMSAESGVPTYRGRGGIWQEYQWEEYACQEAFDRDPAKVLAFHEIRRRSVLACRPHAGHDALAELASRHPDVQIVTQNIDGMHQRAGNRDVIELHGSLWRVRCPVHGVSEDIGESFLRYRCEACGQWLRPDIVWFGDRLDASVMDRAADVIGRSDLFVSVGTSGVVWPAAGFPRLARQRGAYCIEINPEPNDLSPLYNESIRLPAGEVLPRLFGPQSQRRNPS